MRLAHITEQQVWDALATVMDPEIPFSIVDLGLVYGVEVVGGNQVHVKMSLTKRGCPLVRRITTDAEAAIKEHTGANEVQVEIVWDPVWNPLMANDAVRSHFGWS
jgi:metal-sulfur cluster biosynthetic enzyme